MRRTQIYITDEQERRIGEMARDQHVSKAEIIRSVLDAAFNTGDSEAEARSVIESTAGILSDYPGWSEWQKSVRGKSADDRLRGLGL